MFSIKDLRVYGHAKDAIALGLRLHGGLNTVGDMADDIDAKEAHVPNSESIKLLIMDYARRYTQPQRLKKQKKV